tara:strand:+ start:933 stop:1106 length:174 start_codon:yes stop_codon:yes gene_type:complete
MRKPNANLAPFTVRRWFDGTEVSWLVEDAGGNAIGFTTRQEAEEERGTLNTLNAIVF